MGIVELLARDRYKQALLAVLAAVFVASCISPPYAGYLLMQHTPTVLGGVALAWAANRYAISRASFSSIVLFLCLHTLGARYL